MNLQADLKFRVSEIGISDVDLLAISRNILALRRNPPDSSHYLGERVLAVVRWYLEEGVAAGFRWSCGDVLGCLGGLVVSWSSPAGLLVVSWCPGGRGRHCIALSLFGGSTLA